MTASTHETPTECPNSDAEAIAAYLPTSLSYRQFVSECAGDGESVSITMTPPTGDGALSASWSVRGKEHSIVVPEDSGSNSCPGARALIPPSLSQRLRTIEAAIRHETWHGRVTDRDMGVLKYTRDFYEIPTAVLNLFEDARIEAIGREEEEQDFGYFVGPTPLYDHAEISRMSHPCAMFQYVTMCEEDSVAEHHAFAKWEGSEAIEYRGGWYRTVELIRWFVDRARDASTTRHLWSVLLEWKEAFPATCEKEEPPLGPCEEEGKAPSPKRESFERVGLPIPSGYETLSSDALPSTPPDEPSGESLKGPSGKSPDGPPAEGPGADGPADRQLPPTITVSVEDGLSAFTWPQHYTPGFIAGLPWLVTENMMRDIGGDDYRYEGPNLKGASQLAKRLERLVAATESGGTRSATSGTRVHLANAISGSSDAFRRGVPSKGRRKLVLVMDMSGSMCREFREHGGAFMQACLLLHRRHVLDVTVWLTGGAKACRLDGTTRPDVVHMLRAMHGCESLAATLELAKPDLVAAHTVIVYTDGDLTDGDVAANKWRGRGVDLIGAMQAREENGKRARECMDKHFNKSIIADRPDRLASSIIQYVLSH